MKKKKKQMKKKKKKKKEKKKKQMNKPNEETLSAWNNFNLSHLLWRASACCHQRGIHKVVSHGPVKFLSINICPYIVNIC